MKTLTIPLLLITLSPWLFACGSTSFGGRAKSTGHAHRKPLPEESASADAKPKDSKSPNASLQPTKSLEWFLECEGATTSVPLEVDSTIEGGGDFYVAEGPTYGLTFKGRRCGNGTARSDVLFLFDGSLSMSRNDPIVAGSCGRLNTMRTIMRSLGSGKGYRYALVSFSSAATGTLTNSGGFFDSEQGLTAAIENAQGKSIAEAVCNSNRLGTNYNVGFTAADTMIRAAGAADAGTIIFFVSDGQPLFGQTGEAIAAGLRDAGVVIATVMVLGDETIMRDRIASRDAKGAPLHMKVADVGQLPNAISQLASRTIMPDVLRHRPINGNDWVVVDIPPAQNGLDWALPEIVFDKPTYQDGIEVEYSYFLSGGVEKGTVQGTLRFMP